MKPTHGTCDTWAAEGRACSGWSTKCAEVAALQALLAQPAAQAVPVGWKLVPVEPTEAMILAAREHHEGDHYLPVSLWRAMLAAAPEVK
jgi:hypothetical protein